MGGSSVAHGGDRAPQPVQSPPESLQLQQRGNDNNDLPGRYRPARRVCSIYLVSTNSLAISYGYIRCVTEVSYRDRLVVSPTSSPTGMYE